MATLIDLENQVDAALDAAGIETDLGWSEKPVRIVTSTPRATVQVAWTELVVTGSNQEIRLAEVLVTFLRRTSPPSTALFEEWILSTLSTYTAPSWWSALAAVRQSPMPEVEIESEPERIGQVLVFAVRARVALEG